MNVLEGTVSNKICVLVTFNNSSHMQYPNTNHFTYEYSVYSPITSLPFLKTGDVGIFYSCSRNSIVTLKLTLFVRVCCRKTMAFCIYLFSLCRNAAVVSIACGLQPAVHRIEGN